MLWSTMLLHVNALSGITDSSLPLNCFSRVNSMLRSNRISCVGNSSFVGLSSVRLLSLYDNQITSVNPGAFDTLHSLSTL